MKLEDIAQRLEAEIVHRGAGFDRTEIGSVVASDLMSDVLVTDLPRPLILTSLASDQAVRTADIVGAAAVAVVNGKALPENMRRLARELDLTLLRSPRTKFDACLALAPLARR